MKRSPEIFTCNCSYSRQVTYELLSDRSASTLKSLLCAILLLSLWTVNFMPYCINFLHVNFQNYQRKLWDLVYLYTQIAIKIFLLIILIHVCWLIFFPFGSHCMTCGMLVPWPGVEPVHAAVEVWSTNHCTVREFPMLTTLFLYIIVAYLFAFKENMVIFNDHSQLYWISTVFFWASCFGEFGDEWISQSFLSHDLKDLFFF